MIWNARTLQPEGVSAFGTKWKVDFPGLFTCNNILVLSRCASPVWNFPYVCAVFEADPPFRACPLLCPLFWSSCASGNHMVIVCFHGTDLVWVESQARISQQSQMTENFLFYKDFFYSPTHENYVSKYKASTPWYSSVKSKMENNFQYVIIWI